MKPSATWCLHLPNWPPRDRSAWEAAFIGEDWLDDAGPGFHLRPKTREKYAEGYGHWLAWLSDHGLLNPETPPALRATIERLLAYTKWMQGKVAPVTVRIRVEDLCAVLNLLGPVTDLTFFRDVLSRLPKTPIKDKRLGLPDPTDLISLGFDLMDQARANSFERPRFDAVAFRDGLMIALCASRPLRRSNLVALKIGVHLQIIGQVQRIIIPSNQTKACAAINVTWPEPLLLALNEYLADWRPVLLGRYPDNGMLWIAGRGGGSLSAHTMACNFRRHTENALGYAISPHRFRDAAATMMAIKDPANVRVAAAVLGHKSYKTTQKYYNLAVQLDAVDALHNGIESLLNEN